MQNRITIGLTAMDAREHSRNQWFTELLGNVILSVFSVLTATALILLTVLPLMSVLHVHVLWTPVLDWRRFWNGPA